MIQLNSISSELFMIFNSFGRSTDIIMAKEIHSNSLPTATICSRSLTLFTLISLRQGWTQGKKKKPEVKI